MKQESLLHQICRRSDRYFPECGKRSAECRVIESSKRRFSQTYHLELSAGEDARRLFVKVPVEASQHEHLRDNGLRDRPRLVPVIPVRDEVRWEFSALQRIRDHFHSHVDGSCGCPRPLDLIDHRAIVTEGVCADPLSSRLEQSRVWDEQVLTALRNTGAWLRSFHQLESDPQVDARLSNRSELKQTASELIAFLRRLTTKHSNIEAIGRTLDQSLVDVIPIEMETVIGHGDFGPHNVLVDGDLSILGVDTLANWRTSRFEDLAYFLLLLETNQPMFQPRRIDTASMVAGREAFLSGYYRDQRYPDRTLAWYEVLVALDKWASVVHSTRKATSWRRPVKSVRLAIQQHHLQRRIEGLMRRIDSTTGDVAEQCAIQFGDRDAS